MSITIEQVQAIEHQVTVLSPTEARALGAVQRIEEREESNEKNWHNAYDDLRYDDSPFQDANELFEGLIGLSERGIVATPQDTANNHVASFHSDEDPNKFLGFYDVVAEQSGAPRHEVVNDIDTLTDGGLSTLFAYDQGLDPNTVYESVSAVKDEAQLLATTGNLEDAGLLAGPNVEDHLLHSYGPTQRGEAWLELVYSEEF